MYKYFSHLRASVMEVTNSSSQLVICFHFMLMYFCLQGIKLLNFVGISLILRFHSLIITDT